MTRPVLLIDDDPAMLELLELELDSEGIESITARSGRDALEVARGQRPSAVVLDLLLPDLPGIQVLRQLRERDPRLSVIVLTARGRVDEAGVCIGDIYDIGDARVQVSVPRAPCRHIDRRWRTKGLCDASRANGRVGWYSRVLEEGAVEAGQEVLLIERPLPQWSVQRVHEVRHHDKTNLEAAAELAACELLSEEWRGYFRARRPDSGTS